MQCKLAKSNKPETVSAWQYKARAAAVSKQPAPSRPCYQPASNTIHAVSTKPATCMQVQSNAHVRSRLELGSSQIPCGRLHDSAAGTMSRLLIHPHVCKQAYLVAHPLRQEVHAVRLLLNLFLCLLLGICPQPILLLCQALHGLYQAQHLHQTKHSPNAGEDTVFGGQVRSCTMYLCST